MKLKVIIPARVSDYDELVKQLYEQYKLSDMRIDVSHLDKGPNEISTRSDAAKAMPYVMEEAQKAEQAGYDGILVYCFCDPGVRVSRELVRIPIVGLGETALTYAYFLSHRFSIIAATADIFLKKPTYERLCLEYGVLDKLVSVRVLGHSPLKIVNKRDVEIDEIKVEQIRKVIDEDLADTVVLSCGAMSGRLREHEISSEVLIVDSGLVALNFIESLMSLGISHSKLGHLS